MIRKRTSPIWHISRDELIKLVEDCDTMSQVLANFGLKNKGNNNRTIRKRFAEEGIDSSKFEKNYGRGLIKPIRDLNSVLVKDSNYCRTSLKARLLKANLLDNKCGICGLNPEWCGQKLVMILDHINGIPDDNRLKNLRLICPNCNSQTATFAGRKTKKKYFCNCGKPKFTKDSDICVDCRREKTRKCGRPTKNDLQKLLWSMPTSKLAIKYGVSDKAVEKWCKSYGLNKPPRGYWAKNRAEDIGD